eukprot:gnl/TRDRNA2_/TRDRNA2_146015_c0_seq1.p1 gnl/TRDRNA2_/TRDRNA2_146015_c0~~gnl/TRDRNA2_/TRDRNA2_146015_c0_seq1.p1  ORF type:complete len:180 (+),score=21.51 gnl/TRDRNA2_/TRDRNA2_146015_c0_seq1:79-540(+)
MVEALSTWLALEGASCCSRPRIAPDGQDVVEKGRRRASSEFPNGARVGLSWYEAQKVRSGILRDIRREFGSLESPRAAIPTAAPPTSIEAPVAGGTSLWSQRTWSGLSLASQTPTYVPAVEQRTGLKNRQVGMPSLEFEKICVTVNAPSAAAH